MNNLGKKVQPSLGNDASINNSERNIAEKSNAERTASTVEKKSEPNLDLNFDYKEELVAEKKVKSPPRSPKSPKLKQHRTLYASGFSSKDIAHHGEVHVSRVSGAASSKKILNNTHYSGISPKQSRATIDPQADQVSASMKDLNNSQKTYSSNKREKAKSQFKLQQNY